MIPTPHNINSPVGVDRIIKNMQGKLKGNLSWLDACFGKVCRMKDTGELDGKSLNPLYRSFEYLPEEYAGNNEYQRVTPDDNFTSMCYFLVSPATFPEYYPNKFSYVEHDVHIVFWANLDKIDSNLNENYRFTEKLIKDVEFVCTHRFNGIGGRFYLESISEDFRDIYAGFNLQEEANQPIKAPFCGFIVKGRLEYKEGCVIPQPTPNCFDAIIVNSDGTFTFNAPSGIVTEAPNTFVKVVNQSGDELANEEVPSFIESTIIVSDCQPSGDGTAVLKDTDGNVLSTTSVAPETTLDITAPDSTYLVEYENGTPIQSGNIPSGGNEVIQVPNPTICADVDLEINGVTEGIFTSGSTIDLQLTDGVNPVTPVSVGVVGDTVTVTLDTGCPTIGITSMPLATNQQASYADNDDGMLKKGRNFFILDNGELNHFGSKWRFTGVTGGYYDRDTLDYKDVNGNVTTRALAYPSNVVIDFASKDRLGNILMYQFMFIISNWNVMMTIIIPNTINGVSGTKPAGFNDWYMPNWNEVNNVMLKEENLDFFQYEEIGNISGFFIVNTSTSRTSTTYRYINNNGGGGDLEKTQSGVHNFICRIGNISEL